MGHDAAAAFMVFAWICIAALATTVLWAGARLLWRVYGDALPGAPPWVVALPALATGLAVVLGADPLVLSCLVAILASAFVTAGTDQHARLAHDATFVPGLVGAATLAFHSGTQGLAGTAAWAVVAVLAFAALSKLGFLFRGTPAFGSADLVLIGLSMLAFGPLGGLVSLVYGFACVCAYNALQLARGRFVWGRGDEMPMLPGLACGVAIESATGFGPGTPIFHALGLAG